MCMRKNGKCHNEQYETLLHALALRFIAIATHGMLFHRPFHLNIHTHLKAYTPKRLSQNISTQPLYVRFSAVYLEDFDFNGMGNFEKRTLTALVIPDKD